MKKTVSRGHVSVVVASYNHAGYLDRRMKSLIGQTYSDIDILVIDDNSPDNSVEILRQYEEDSRVRLVVREKNGGWVTVSNQGLAQTSGEYVIFANCDDYCEPQMIERLVAMMDEYPSAGIGFCKSFMVDERDRVFGDDFTEQEAAFRKRCNADTLLTSAEASQFLLYSCVIPNLSGAIFRREILEEVGGFSSTYKVCCDWELFLRIAADYDIAYVATPLNCFRQHRNTIRSQSGENLIFDEICSLLLPKIRMVALGKVERFRYRQRVMYLWAVNLLRPSRSGWDGTLQRLKNIWEIDSFALFGLPTALAIRLMELPWKGARRLLRTV